MSEYTVAKVSANSPRTWAFKDKRTGADIQMETYKVMLDGIDEPVDLNRKPHNPPNKGEVLIGSLEDSDFGKKFKPERKPFTPGGKDEKAIRAMWAINAAIAWLTDSTPDPDDIAKIESLATDFFAMVDRVKGAESIKPDKVFPVEDGEPVKLDDIPDQFK
jgi:hypothetical protein